ncbi:unnamed protein product [Nesidiocoris tenuis]|uniref:Uncharacterized protein n=1 Tax=Nesidiocoris tenuis TaxID=355587 RepID=A0A6H5GTD2_9HEMI|nr:unnamed protein product [Nesidiocoris tenuis]
MGRKKKLGQNRRRKPDYGGQRGYETGGKVEGFVAKRLLKLTVRQKLEQKLMINPNNSITIKQKVELAMNATTGNCEYIYPTLVVEGVLMLYGSNHF